VKLYSKDICEEPKIDLNLFSSNNHEQTYEPRVANLTKTSRTTSTDSFRPLVSSTVMMMMPFYCSYRNKNEPSAIYPSFGYSLGSDPWPSRP
jgi:hypothetical protein